MPLCNDIIKEREIRFTYSLTEADQAEKAVRLLAGIVGIELVVPIRINILRVRYDIREITMQALESALIDVGFTLQTSLTLQLKREVIAYCEDALRSSLGIEADNQQPPLTFTKATPLRHNLDPRPDNWRNYI
ncbi:MAG: hypothetical protein OEY66_04605 [Gammaproteobacteria bacterium]|nr:hypothetical protein [Gammaproteobacteria bacterium]